MDIVVAGEFAKSVLISICILACIVYLFVLWIEYDLYYSRTPTDKITIMRININTRMMVVTTSTLMSVAIVILITKTYHSIETINQIMRL